MSVKVSMNIIFLNVKKMQYVNAVASVSEVNTCYKRKFTYICECANNLCVIIIHPKTYVWYEKLIRSFRHIFGKYTCRNYISSVSGDVKLTLMRMRLVSNQKSVWRACLIIFLSGILQGNKNSHILSVLGVCSHFKGVG